MPADVRVEGVDKLERVARRLKDIGDKELRRDLYRGIQRATKPMRENAKQSARDNLPARGGLNEFVASSRLSTSTRGGGRNPGVRIDAKKAGHDIRAINRGRLRHPVFGNRSVWVTQDVKPGWFTESLDKDAPLVRDEIVTVLDELARRIGG